MSLFKSKKSKVFVNIYIFIVYLCFIMNNPSCFRCLNTQVRGPLGPAGRCLACAAGRGVAERSVARWGVAGRSVGGGEKRLSHEQHALSLSITLYKSLLYIYKDEALRNVDDYDDFHDDVDDDAVAMTTVKDVMPGRSESRPLHCSQGRGSEQLVPADHHGGQVEIVQHDLRHAHEHLLALDTTVVAPHRHLKYTACEIFSKNKLLLIQRV